MLEDIKRKLKEFIETQEVREDIFGLCTNCNLVYLDNYKDLFESWEHFSGSHAYPVPADHEIIEQYITSPDYEYYNSEDGIPEYSYDTCKLYEGNQLKLRLSLAKHILKELEK